MVVPDNKHTHQYDVIIVGAGVVGTSIAAALGKDGRKVLLIERDWKEPDRIVGEYLQPGGVSALQKLGLEDCIEGIDGIESQGYYVFPSPTDNIEIKYPKNICPNNGISFHHGRFIMKLRQAAQSAPNVTCLEGTVSSLIKSPDNDNIVQGISVSIKDQDGLQNTILAPLTIVADGCFSKFRKQFISKEVTVKSHFVGFVLEDCPLPFPNYGHVILAEPSPILLYQIGTRDTRILVDIPGKLPGVSNGALQSYMENNVGPQLPKVVQDSFYKALKTERLRSMPNSWLPPSTNKPLGVILVGDSMNMRHPLTGGGMTVALWDVVHIRDLLSQVPDFSQVELVDAQIKKLHWKRKPLSSVINILAQALYDLFSAGDDPYLKQLQRACLGYFRLGGKCVSTPAGLLGGIIPSPLTLLRHFFAVALYGTWLMIKEAPIYMIPVVFVQAIIVLLTACKVIFPVLYSELRS